MFDGFPVRLLNFISSFFGEILHPSLAGADLDVEAKAIARQLSAEMICFPVHQQAQASEFPRWAETIEATLGAAA